MTIDKNNLLNSILDSMDRIQYIKLEDIPNIDLYMDQVTTFMDSKLKKSTRNQEEDKILTKTMINNYTKNELLPPPEKKKYSRDHIIMLIFIYYYKGILSINDIQSLLTPIKENFFDTDKEFDLGNIYKEIFALEKGQVKEVKEDIIKKFEHSRETFATAPEDEQEFLHVFAFICMLGFDVYVKNLLIEKMIDQLERPGGNNKRNDLKKDEKLDK
jgi:hypothetical protein